MIVQLCQLTIAGSVLLLVTIAYMLSSHYHTSHRTTSVICIYCDIACVVGDDHYSSTMSTDGRNDNDDNNGQKDWPLPNEVSGVPMLEKAGEKKWGKDPEYQRYMKAGPGHAVALLLLFLIKACSQQSLTSHIHLCW